MKDLRPRLHLHAGTHKTGTTAIQRFAAENRAELQKNGLLYPTYTNRFRTPNESHLALFHAIAGERSPIRKNQVPKIINGWWQNACEDNLEVLLSAEAIWRHQISESNSDWSTKRRMYLRTISRLLENFDVHVHVVLRDQERFLVSSYQENVRKGTPAGRLPFIEYARRQLKSSLRYLENLLLLENCIGPVRVSLYDDLQKAPGLVANFFSRLGMDTSGLSSHERVRQSLSIAQTIVKRYLNEHSTLRNEEQISLIENHRFIAEIEPAIGACSLWPSSRRRNNFLARFTEENEELRKRWFPNHDRLFDYSDPAQPDSNFREIPSEIVAELYEWERTWGAGGSR